MTLEEVQDAIEAYFSDPSRPRQETANGLRELADNCTARAECIESELESKDD